MTDQYLLCRAPDGSLLHIAQILGDGIELQDRVISLEKFQELLGPKPCVTFLDGRVANSTSISAAIINAAAATSAVHQQPLLDDENDEFCLICSLGGDLICCETCPATFHTECIGLAEIPGDDWFCPACSCCAPSTLKGAIKTPKTKSSPPVSPELIPCSNYTSHRLQNKEEKEQEKIAVEEGDLLVDGQLGAGDKVSHAGCKRPTRNKLWMYQKLHLEDAGLPPPLYKFQKERESSPPQQEGQKQRNNPAANGNGTGEEGNEKIDEKQVPTREEEKENESARQRALAECCALGEIPIGQVYAATKPLQISFQLIHAAAVNIPSLNNFSSSAAAATTKSPRARGNGATRTTQNSNKTNIIMPSYSKSQKSELRQVLSAALYLIHAIYAPLLDSRTGCDVLPWLFRGKTFTKSVHADYSTMHVAVLFAGSTIAGVACVRSLGNGIAEIPIFTVREELRRNRLGENFLSQIEKVLHQAGIELIITPAMILPGWPFTPSSFPRKHEAEKNQIVPFLPMQYKWGYTLATREEMQRIAKVRPLAFPGVYTCVKRLYCADEAKAVAGGDSPNVEKSSTIIDSSINHKPLVPRTLPHSLAIAPEINVDLLRKRGFIELRCDQGTSNIIPMNAAIGFELMIKTAAADIVENGHAAIVHNQGSIERAGPHGAGGLRDGKSVAERGGGGGGFNNEERKHQQRQEGKPTISPASEPKPAKRKYTKRKQQGIDVGSEDGNTRGRKKEIVVQPPQAPQVLLVQQAQQQQQQRGLFPRGGLGPPTGAAAPLLHYSYPPQPQLPPGVPVLQSLMHPNHLLPLHSHQNVPNDLDTIHQLQTMQAQQLAQMEDAIRQEQTSLLQGMNRFREQQQHLAMMQQQQQGHQGPGQQQEYSTNGYFAQQIGDGINMGEGQYPAGQLQQSIYNGTAIDAAGQVVGGGGGGGYYHQYQQQQYYQQQYDELPPLHSIYENHQRLQQQHQQIQSSIMAPLTVPGQLYYPSITQPQQQQQQQQEFDPLLMPQAPPPPPPSYYYHGDGNGNGM